MDHLNPGVADAANFLAVEALPLSLVESGHQGQDVFGLDHVDEGVAHIALVLEINWQVKEVILSAELLVDGLKKHLLCVFVRDILYHQCCARILSCTAQAFRRWSSNMEIRNTRSMISFTFLCLNGPQKARCPASLQIAVKYQRLQDSHQFSLYFTSFHFTSSW